MSTIRRDVTIPAGTSLRDTFHALAAGMTPAERHDLFVEAGLHVARQLAERGSILRSHVPSVAAGITRRLEATWRPTH